MTKEEHVARAMLLGKIYDPQDHTYCDGRDGDGGPWPEGMLDPDTLEPLPIQGYDYMDGPIRQRRELVASGQIGPSK